MKRFKSNVQEKKPCCESLLLQSRLLYLQKRKGQQRTWRGRRDQVEGEESREWKEVRLRGGLIGRKGWAEEEGGQGHEGRRVMLVLRRRERSRCNESWISFNVCLRWGRCFVDTQSCFWFLVGHIREIVSFYLSFFLLPQHQDLQDGSMLTDFLGREECRTFVLGDQVNIFKLDNLKHSQFSGRRWLCWPVWQCKHRGLAPASALKQGDPANHPWTRWIQHSNMSPK